MAYFAARYFARRYFAPRYFPSGAAAPVTPHIVLTPSVLQFGAVVATTSPPSQQSIVSNSGTGSVTPSLGSITYIDGSGWLSVGIVVNTITATVDITALAIGTYQATVPVISAGADNTPQTLTIILRIRSASSPIGFWTAGTAGTGGQTGDWAQTWPSASYNTGGGVNSWPT